MACDWVQSKPASITWLSGFHSLWSVSYSGSVIHWETCERLDLGTAPHSHILTRYASQSHIYRFFVSSGSGIFLKFSRLLRTFFFFCSFLLFFLWFITPSANARLAFSLNTIRVLACQVQSCWLGWCRFAKKAGILWEVSCLEEPFFCFVEKWPWLCCWRSSWIQNGCQWGSFGFQHT